LTRGGPGGRERWPENKASDKSLEVSDRPVFAECRCVRFLEPGTPAQGLGGTVHVRATRLWDAPVEAGGGRCEIHTAFLALLLAFGLKVCVQGVLALLAKWAWARATEGGRCAGLTAILSVQ